MNDFCPYIKIDCALLQDVDSNKIDFFQEEYKYCYDIAQDYLDSFDHDSNI